MNREIRRTFTKFDKKTLELHFNEKTAFFKQILPPDQFTYLLELLMVTKELGRKN